MTHIPRQASFLSLEYFPKSKTREAAEIQKAASRHRYQCRFLIDSGPRSRGIEATAAKTSKMPGLPKESSRPSPPHAADF